MDLVSLEGVGARVQSFGFRALSLRFLGLGVGV